MRASRLAAWGSCVGLVLGLQPGRAQAGLPVIDSSNLAQNVISAVQATLAVAQQVKSVALEGRQVQQQIQQLRNEIQMLQDMRVNSARAGTVAWGELQTTLQSLGTAIETGLSLPYLAADVGRAFQARFPGYAPPEDWAVAYDAWSTTVLDTLRGTLQAAGRNVSDASRVHSALLSLRAENDGAEGRLQAIQVGNQLSSLMVEELAKLRHLVAGQTDAQNAYLGAQEAKAAGSAAAFHSWLQHAPSSIPVSRPAEGLGAAPRPRRDR